jgi:hypothetical protein
MVTEIVPVQWFLPNITEAFRCWDSDEGKRFLTEELVRADIRIAILAQSFGNSWYNS